MKFKGENLFRLILLLDIKDSILAVCIWIIFSIEQLVLHVLIVVLISCMCMKVPSYSNRVQSTYVQCTPVVTAEVV